MKQLIISLTLLFLFSLSYSQPDIPEEQYFDFWIGEWDLTWQYADGSTGKGKNIINRVLDDKVIQENFEGLTGQYKGFIGKSWSVYSPQTNQWKQTWVDNQGAYLDFWAEFDGDKRMFVRKFTGPQGNEVSQRMVFRDIMDDAFTWDWESSIDGGESWTLQWQINYKRMDSETIR
jgi:hypothetical protein